MAFNEVSVHFDNVRCGYPKADFSLSIDQQAHEGEVIAVIGTNGSGKSTFLQSLSLTLPVKAGQIRFQVRKKDELSEQVVGSHTGLDHRGIRYFRNRFIGCVPQDHGLLSSLTVAENVSLTSDIAGRQIPHAEILAALAQYGVETLANRRASTLSVGQQQRVALTSGLFHKPAIVLLDEPTAAIQANNARQFMSLAREYARRESAIVIMACHDLALAAEFADRYWLFADGQAQEFNSQGGRSEWRTTEEIHRLCQQLSRAMFSHMGEPDSTSFIKGAHYVAS